MIEGFAAADHRRARGRDAHPPARREGSRCTCRWRTSCSGVGRLAVCRSAIWDDEAIAVYERQAQLVRDAGALAELPIHLQALALERAWRGDLPGARGLVAEAEGIAQSIGNQVPPFALLRTPGPAGTGSRGLPLDRGRRSERARQRTGNRGDDCALGGRGAVQRPRTLRGGSGGGRGKSSRTACFPGCPCGRGSSWSRPPRAPATSRSRGMHWTGSRRPHSLPAPASRSASRRVVGRLSGMATMPKRRIAKRSSSWVEPGIAPSSPERICSSVSGCAARAASAEAREQLRAAEEMFAEIGMEAFAERARGELVAAGGRLRTPAVEARERAHSAGGADRPARPRRSHEPADRRPVVPQSAHRRVAPAQGVRQARDQLARRPSRRAAKTRTGRRRACGSVSVRARCPPPVPGFLGRTSEREVLDGLLANVRGGQSDVLVIRGEAGIGKTALLRYAARQAAGFRVAQVTGVEAEMELPFAGIHQLCAPMLDRLDALPRPQRDALSVALGCRDRRRPGPVPGRTGRAQPVVCRRRGAAAALSRGGRAVARCRLGPGPRLRRATGAGGVGGDRGRRSRAGADRAPRLRRPARASRSKGCARRMRAPCWRGVVPGRLDDRVRDRIVAETRGNPLALLELPRAHDRRGAGRRLRASRRGRPSGAHRGPLPAARRRAARGDAATDAAGGRRPVGGRRRWSGVRAGGSRSRPARSRPPRLRSCWRSERASGSAIRWCARRSIGRRRPTTGSGCTRSWRR